MKIRKRFLVASITFFLGLLIFLVGLSYKLNQIIADYLVRKIAHVLLVEDSSEISVTESYSDAQGLTMRGIQIGKSGQGSINKLTVRTSWRGILFGGHAIDYLAIDGFHADLSKASVLSIIGHNLEGLAHRTVFSFSVWPKQIMLKNLHMNVLLAGHNVMLNNLELKQKTTTGKATQLSFALEQLEIDQKAFVSGITGEVKKQNQDRWLVTYNTEHLQGQVTVEPDQSFDIRNDFENFSINHPLIAPTAVDIPWLSVAASGRLVRKPFALDLDDVAVRLGRKPSSQIHFSGQIAENAADEAFNVRAVAEIPLTSCQDLIRSVPSGFAPLFADFSLRGNLQGRASIELVTSRPTEFKATVDQMDFGCVVESTGIDFHPQKLKDTRRLASQKELKSSYLRNVGGENFTPLEQIAPITIETILTSEDIRFFQHRGFDWETLEKALRRNLNEGRVVLGGSTISMQTAKNLFLSNERNIARKAQEALLTWHLEQSLTKQRILELYLNMVEFGPGVFGITEASRHFFGKGPADLSLLESAYLATLLPSPEKRYRYFCNRRLTPAFERLLHDKLKVMYDLKRIDQAQYEGAKGSNIVFSEQSSPRCATSSAALTEPDSTNM